MTDQSVCIPGGTDPGYIGLNPSSENTEKLTMSDNADQTAAAESENNATAAPDGAAEEPAQQMHSHQSAGAATRAASATVSRKQAKKEAKQRRKMEKQGKKGAGKMGAVAAAAAQGPTEQDLTERLRMLVRKDTNAHVILNDCEGGEGALFGDKLGDDYRKTIEDWVREGGDPSKVDFDGMRSIIFDDFKSFMVSGVHTRTEADLASEVTLKDLNRRLMDLYEKHQALNIVEKAIIRKDTNAIVAQWLAEAGGRYSPQQWGAEVNAVRDALVKKYGVPEVDQIPAAEREREEILKKFYDRCRDELKAYWNRSMDEIAAESPGVSVEAYENAKPEQGLDECFANLKLDRDLAVKRGITQKKIGEVWIKAKNDFLNRPVSKKQMDEVAQLAKERITNGEDPNVVIQDVLRAINA